MSVPDLELTKGGVDGNCTSWRRRDYGDVCASKVICDFADRRGIRNDKIDFDEEYRFRCRVLIGIASLPASAAVIYNGGAPDQGETLYAQSPAAVAIRFTLSAGSSVVTGANWWGGCFPATPCGASPDFTVGYLADNNGTPGAPIIEVDFGDANQTATGKVIGGPGGYDEYAYSVSSPPYSGLTAGTPYWFFIQENNAEPGGSWGAETTSTAPVGQLRLSSTCSRPTHGPLCQNSWRSI